MSFGSPGGTISKRFSTFVADSFIFLYNYAASSQIACDPKFFEQHSKEETNNVLSGSHYPGLQAGGVAVSAVLGALGACWIVLFTA